MRTVKGGQDSRHADMFCHFTSRCYNDLNNCYLNHQANCLMGERQL